MRTGYGQWEETVVDTIDTRSVIMIARDKKDYIEHWSEHIQELRRLQLTPDCELGAEVMRAVDKVQDLMYRVADDKYGK